MKRGVKIFLDDEKQALNEFSPPASFTLDTTRIPDGPHTLKIVARSSDGVEGLKTIAFTVRNGPEIELSGLKPQEVVSDQLELTINAYGSESREQFIVAGSETPKAVPAWLWVTLLAFVAWAIYYAFTYWS